jgi:hypothetical protein
MSKLDIDTIRRSGDATSIADRSKALMELHDRVGNHEMTLNAGVEAAVAAFGNNTPQFKARCELLFALNSCRAEKEDEAVSIGESFSTSRSKGVTLGIQ